MSTQLSDKDVSEIKALLNEKWIPFFLNADWDKFTGLLTDDIVFMPPDQPAAEGKEAVRAWLEQFMPIREYTISVIRAEGRDDFAWIWATFAVAAEPEPGKPVSLRGKATCTCRKQPDGSWRIASDIWNLDEPLPAG